MIDGENDEHDEAVTIMNDEEQQQPPPPPTTASSSSPHSSLPKEEEEEDEGGEEGAGGEESPLIPLIRPIPEGSVGRIVAGQAVTDLGSAVKELLDNAIDAGARRVWGESSSSCMFPFPFSFVSFVFCGCPPFHRGHLFSLYSLSVAEYLK